MVPADATSETHSSERDQFKTCALGVLYGLTAEGLARKLDAPAETGRQLLRHHHNCYPDFWEVEPGPCLAGPAPAGDADRDGLEDEGAAKA